MGQPPPGFLQGPPSNFAYPPPVPGSAALPATAVPPGSRQLIQGPPPNLAMMHPHAQLVGALQLPPPPNALPAQQPPPGFHQALGSNLLSAMAAAAGLAGPPGAPAAAPGFPPNMFNGPPGAANLLQSGFNPMMAAAGGHMGIVGPGGKISFNFTVCIFKFQY